MARALWWLLLLLLLLLVCSCAQSFLWRWTRGVSLSKERYPTVGWFQHPTDGWFQQKLDHFSKKSSPVWIQRFFMNDAFYKPGGPVFLMIEGEMAASREWVLNNYTWITYAERLGALCLLLEHRFYGKSQPTGDLSTDSFRYLSSRQAIADIVNFRTNLGKKMGLTRNKWVVFGGSYGGSLAVWSRIKYPKRFAAAVGSSAPIQAKVNFYEFFEEIHKILVTHNSECSNVVKEALAHIVEMLKHPEYYSKLKDDFMLCKPLIINSMMDTTLFMHIVIHFSSSIIENNIKNENIEVGQNEISIDDLCALMNDNSLGSPYDRYARLGNLIVKMKKMPCLTADYSDFLEHYSDSSVDEENTVGVRQWFYQSCTEFGFFMTTESKNHPFSGLPLRYFVKRCSDLFGPELNYDLVIRGVNATNMYYGGFNVKGKKIIFINGSNDPWHPLGITKDISEDLPAIFIKGEAHCSDMYKATNVDSSELIQAREKIFQILKQWLKR